MKYLFLYYLIINIIAALITIMDKLKAKSGKWRISERALIMLGIIGGAPLEYITMKLIRHKTRHKKFMIGLPAIMIIHIALLILYIVKVAL